MRIIYRNDIRILYTLHLRLYDSHGAYVTHHVVGIDLYNNVYA
jgi:hypothetical protein